MAPRFRVNGYDVSREDYIAEHERVYGEPPQDIGDSGVLMIGPLFAPLTVARAIHAANREVQRALGEEVNPEWDALPADMQAGLLSAVERGAIAPAESHNEWMAHWLANGWTLGPKNLEARTSPNLVPYDELPPEQRAKDALTLGILAALTVTPA